MLRRRTRCNSNFGPSSFRRMCRRSWSRASPRSFSSCRWKRASWATRSTVHQRQPYCSPPTPSRPSLKTTTKSFTDPDTWCLNACCRTGETRLNLRICPRLLASISTWSHDWVSTAIVSARCVLNYTKKEKNQISSFFEVEHKSRFNYRICAGSASSLSLFRAPLSHLLLL